MSELKQVEATNEKSLAQIAYESLPLRERQWAERSLDVECRWKVIAEAVEAEVLRRTDVKGLNREISRLEFERQRLVAETLRLESAISLTSRFLCGTEKTTMLAGYCSKCGLLAPVVHLGNNTLWWCSNCELAADKDAADFEEHYNKSQPCTPTADETPIVTVITESAEFRDEYRIYLPMRTK